MGGSGPVPNRLPHDFRKKSSEGAFGKKKLPIRMKIHAT
jgi:hypothetical protein